MDQPRQLCPNGNNCPDMKKGDCTYWHTKCPLEDNCDAWKRMQCPLYHYQPYARHLQRQQQQKSHTERHTNHHHHNQRNQRIFSNSTTAFHDEANHLPKETATRGRTLWAEWEDKILLKHARQHNGKMDKYMAAEVREELRNGRTVGAIQTRFNGTILPKITAQQNKRLRQSAGNAVNSVRCPGNSTNKLRVYSLFKTLIKYYKHQCNQFDAKNLENKLAEFEKKKWNGNAQQMNKILLNTPLKHFEDKLKKMEQEYGKIDLDKEKQIMDTLNNVKNALTQCIKDTNKTIKVVKGKMFVNDSDFAEITGYDIAYFENVLNAINAPKIQQQDDEKMSDSEVKQERINNNHCAMPKLEEDEDSHTDSKDDNVSIKQEESVDFISTNTNTNTNGTSFKTSRQHRDRSVDRRRSRSRSRHTHRERYHDPHRSRDRERRRSRSRDRGRSHRRLSNRSRHRNHHSSRHHSSSTRSRSRY